jgi:hypothetical protein
MNSPRCWQLRDDECSDIGTNANTLSAFQREWRNSVQPLKKLTQMHRSLSHDEFHSRVRKLSPNCQQLYEVTRNLYSKRLSQDGGQADFSKKKRPRVKAV